MYDGNLYANLIYYNSISSDIISYNASFDNINVGINKLITISLSDIVIVTNNNNITIINNYFTNPYHSYGGWSHSNINGWTINTGNFYFGIATNGSPWSNVLLPSGITQFLFCQVLTSNTYARIYQSISLTSGYYSLSFYYSARYGYYNSNYTLTVLIDSFIVVSNLVADSTMWKYYNNTFYISSGSNLTFVFNSTDNGDKAYLITGIELYLINNNNNYQLVKV